MLSADADPLTWKDMEGHGYECFSLVGHVPEELSAGIACCSQMLIWDCVIAWVSLQCPVLLGLLCLRCLWQSRMPVNCWGFLMPS